MAKFTFEGVDELIAEYEKLNKNSTEVIGKAIYEGAATVMKSVKAAVNGLNIDNRFGTQDDPTTGPTTLQKIGLQKSLGIAPMRQDGNFWNVKIGFDGYNSVKTKTWPNGQPNILVARSVESGTSWMTKQPFMRKAEKESKARCEKVMGETVDKEIKKLIGD